MSFTTDETCAICLSAYTQEVKVANPNSCNHSFCRSCLKNWAQRRQICPLDRMRFDQIIIFKNFNEYTKAIGSLQETEILSEIICAICGHMKCNQVMKNCMVCKAQCHKKCLHSTQIPVCLRDCCSPLTRRLSEIDATVTQPRMEIDSTDEDEDLTDAEVTDGESMDGESMEGESTDEYVLDAEETDAELTDEELMDEELMDEELTDEYLMDAEDTYEDLMDEEFMDEVNLDEIEFPASETDASDEDMPVIWEEVIIFRVLPDDSEILD